MSDERLLSVALVHQPVCNRLGEVITSTVDHFDVMDASRLSLTYRMRRFYVVVDEPSQRALVERLFRHGNATGERDEARGDFSRMAWAPDLQAVTDELARELGRRPTIVVTSAQPQEGSTGFAELRARLEGGEAMVVVVGKAWGLAPALLRGADVRLAAIDGGTSFNHLSVRSAMAIVIDRLLG